MKVAKLLALLAVCLSLCTLMACEISSGKGTNEEEKTEVSDKVSGGSSLKIVFTNNNGGEIYSSALVNAQLYK